ncbi:MAG: DUF4430 domain-containing protein [Gaiellaceae bacterium]|jgi:hypothetical protein
MKKHALLAIISVLAAGIFAPLATAVSVSVRVEGKTRTIFGPTEPTLQVASNALDALEAAATAGEFYYHLASGSYGSYVDQIGLYPAAGSSGWVFKVNGVLPPVGADKVTLKDGDHVLWYWSSFDPVTFAAAKTLLLERSKLTRAELKLVRRTHKGRYCYRVLAQDDKGVTEAASGSVLQVGSRRAVRTKNGRACIGPHSGLLVRAAMTGAVRSNALA